MKGKLYIIIGIAIVLLNSCGTNKKLEASQGQVNDLTERNNQLNQKNTELTKTIDQLNGQIVTLTDQNKKMSADFADYQKQCATVQEKYKTSHAILQEQERILKQIEDKLQTALTDLENRGLSVHHERGLVYVSMNDELLYSPGSSKLDKKGIEALSKIAGVMNDYPDVKVIVVGNTDDAKFKTATDNWSLSTERANGVVRALRDVYKIDPVRLTAAGRGKFDPVADNASAEGRAKNRRTDIIFSPDLDKLWDNIELE
jgi:chemotaxis protein MotB